MNSTYTVSSFIKRNGNNSKHRIYLRIIVDGQRSEISIARSIEAENWDSKFGRVKGRRENAREINSLLDTITHKINKIHSKLIEQDSPITAELIKNIYFGRTGGKKMLMDVFRYHNEFARNRIGIDFTKATFIRYQTTYDHIKRFLKKEYSKEDFELSRLNYSFILSLENYFKVVRKCSHNTTLKYIRNFRKVINLAIQNDWLEKDPFKSYRIKLKEVKRTFLTWEELNILEEKTLHINRLERVRDVFVFCCYTGLSYVDVEKLTQREISLGIDERLWVFIDRTKTGNSSHIPLLPKAIQILEKYRDDPEVLSTGKVLPVISNQRINSYLKELGVLCDLNKNLTFHAARHTFATTVTLTNGIPIESISAMLGHKNLRTTQHYAKILDKKIGEDMTVLRNRLTVLTDPQN